MYLHLGQDTVVREEDIVGIFDLDNTTVSKATNGFLNAAEKNGSLINITDDIPKSFILCSENGKNKVYFSQLATSTLQKRANFLKTVQRD